MSAQPTSYLAAGTYFENNAGILGKKYKADMDQKEKALQLELKLAGIPPAIRNQLGQTRLINSSSSATANRINRV